MGRVAGAMKDRQGDIEDQRRGARYVPPAEWRTIPVAMLLQNVSAFSFESGRGLVVTEATASSTKLPFTEAYAAGDVTILRSPRVAVVGARKVTPKGAERARKLARELSAAGVVVVSGLAEGVDTHAHAGAIESGGRTVAVIGTPLEKAYPAGNARLQELIYREHLLISPFAPGSRTFAGSFPQRNKLMATMTDATVIIEASDTSGTLHQAAECQRLGRLLFIARSAVDDPRVSWPSRFIGHPLTRVLDNTEALLRDISPGAF